MQQEKFAPDLLQIRHELLGAVDKLDLTRINQIIDCSDSEIIDEEMFLKIINSTFSDKIYRDLVSKIFHKITLQQKINLVRFRDENQNSIFHLLSILLSDHSVFKELYKILEHIENEEKLAIINHENNYGLSVLDLFASHEFIHGIKMYLDLMPEDKKLSMIKYLEKFAILPLHIAVIYDDANSVREIFHQDKICSRAQYKKNPILIASANNCGNSLSVLLDLGFDINYRENGIGALHLASQKGFAQIIKILIDKNAQIDLDSDEFITTELTLALENDSLEIADMLLKHANHRKEEYLYKKNKYGNNVLQIMVIKGKAEMVNFLLEQVENVDEYLFSQNDRNNNALFLAVIYNKNEIVRYLMQQTKDKERYLYIQNLSQNTVIHLAIINKNSEAIDLLLPLLSGKKEEYFFIQNSNGGNILHLAVIYNKLEIVHFLFQQLFEKKEEYLYVKNGEGHNPLHLAVMFEIESVAEFLLSQAKEKEEYLFLKNKNGDNSLHLAITFDLRQIADFLLNQAQDKEEYLYTQNADGDNPMHLAIVAGNLDVVNFLLSQTRDKKKYLYAQTGDGDNPLHLAIVADKIFVFNFLLSQIDDLESYIYDQNSENDNALHLAVRYLQIEMVKILLSKVEKKEDYILMQGYQGNNILHYAVLSNGLNIVQMISAITSIELASIQKNILNINPIELAIINGKLDFIKFFYDCDLLKHAQEIENVNGEVMKFIKFLTENYSHQIKDKITLAYQEFFKLNDIEFIGKISDDELNFSTFALISRFIFENTFERGGIEEIVEKVIPIIDYIFENPQSLESFDKISKDFLANCVNQPVKGFTVIANMVEMATQEDMFKKLKIAKRIQAIEALNSKVIDIPELPANLQVSFGNLMLKEIHELLIERKEIEDKWLGVPTEISQSINLSKYSNSKIREEIYKVVLEILKQPIDENFAQSVCEGCIGDISRQFWANITMPKEQYHELLIAVRIAKEKYLEDFDPEKLAEIHEVSERQTQKMIDMTKEITIKKLSLKMPSSDPQGRDFSSLDNSKLQKNSLGIS